MKAALAFVALLASCNGCRRDQPARRSPARDRLHGNGGTGHQIRKFTHFAEIAARDGFVVAYPDAIDHAWNDGRPEVVA